MSRAAPSCPVLPGWCLPVLGNLAREGKAAPGKEGAMGIRVRWSSVRAGTRRGDVKQSQGAGKRLAKSREGKAALVFPVPSAPTFSPPARTAPPGWSRSYPAIPVPRWFPRPGGAQRAGSPRRGRWESSPPAGDGELISVARFFPGRRAPAGRGSPRAVKPERGGGLTEGVGSGPATHLR